MLSSAKSAHSRGILRVILPEDFGAYIGQLSRIFNNLEIAPRSDVENKQHRVPWETGAPAATDSQYQ